MFVRLCALKESPQDYMQPSAYADLVYNNWLLDIPTCVFFGVHICVRAYCGGGAFDKFSVSCVRQVSLGLGAGA